MDTPETRDFFHVVKTRTAMHWAGSLLRVAAAAILVLCCLTFPVSCELGELAKPTVAKMSQLQTLQAELKSAGTEIIKLKRLAHPKNAKLRAENRRLRAALKEFSQLGEKAQAHTKNAPLKEPPTENAKLVARVAESVGQSESEQPTLGEVSYSH